MYNEHFEYMNLYSQINTLKKENEQLKASLNNLLKTSEEWLDTSEFCHIEILDHSSWDMFEFYNKHITHEEFKKRLLKSKIALKKIVRESL